MAGRGNPGDMWNTRGGNRVGRGSIEDMRDEHQALRNRFEQRNSFRGGQFQQPQWMYREVNRRNLPNQNRDPQFDLRNNLNQGREKAHRV